jgi:NADH/NAD ratio-sensing transcriptional regulator Rex
MIRLCFSAARDLAFLSAAPEQGEKSTAMRIVGLSGVGVFGNAILRPPFSQTNSIQIFTIINIQQLIGKRPQDLEEIPFCFRIISNDFNGFT